ncbi:MAG: tetratricopeptide repeat protein [Endomicrobiales bacterium]|nr:tetratricopeptide repeat protein [Endomicrobiales bacterium]
MKKAGLILLGIILSAAVLEIGIRSAGYVLVKVRDYKDRAMSSMASYKDKYVIMCLGESTTEGQYPGCLEQELNKRNLGVEFKVIDEGKGGCTTSYVLANLEYNIEKYKPDMIIAMMGINDGKDEVVFESRENAEIIKSLKIYKLAFLLASYIKSTAGFGKKHDIKAVKTDDAGLQKKKNIVEEVQKKIDIAEKYQAKGRYEESEKIYKGIIEKYPDYQWGYIGLGFAYDEQGKQKKAKEFILKGFRLAAYDKWVYILVNDYFNKIENSNELAKEYNKLMETNPGNEYIYAGFGKFCIEQGSDRKAGELFKEAMRINPGNEWVCSELGNYYLERGLNKQAEKLFNKAIKINPGNELIYTKLSICYLNQDLNEKADKSLKKAIAISPKNEWIYMEMGNYYTKRGLYKKAERFYRKAAEVIPGYRAAYMKLCKSYIEQGLDSQAEEALKKALEVNPKDGALYLEAGKCYMEQGLNKKAKDLLRQAIKINPDNEWPYILLGRMCRNKGDNKKAEDLLKKAIAINPENEWAYKELAIACRRQGLNKEAEQLMKKVIELNPDNDIAYLELARFYQNRDLFTEAMELMEKAIEMHRSKTQKQSGSKKSVTLSLKKLEGRKTGWYSLAAKYNYNKLKEIVLDKRIKLACMQYPTMIIDPLKELLEPNEGIIFMSNKEMFEDAVNKEGSERYFYDVSSGDFGNFTIKGNKLIAKNIADVLEKEIFQR